MKSYLLVLLLLTSSLAGASDKTEFNAYFDKFIAVFSEGSVSDKDYDLLINLDKSSVEASFINSDAFPEMLSYLPNDKTLKQFISVNSDVIFNGNKSRHFYLQYLKDISLTETSSPIQKKVFKVGTIQYSFYLAKYNVDEVSVQENIFFPLPGDEDNVFEQSCIYTFGNKDKKGIKLNKIMCAN